MKKSKRLLGPALVGLLALNAQAGLLFAQPEEGASSEPYVSGPERGTGPLDSQRPGRMGPGAHGHRPHGGHGPGLFGTDGPGGPGGLMFALRELDPSEDQRAQIREILEQDREQVEAHREDMRALRAELEEQIETDPLDENAVRAKATAVGSLGVEMAVLRARQVGQVRELLTPDQLSQLEQLKAERESFRDHRRERFERRRVPRTGS